MKGWEKLEEFYVVSWVGMRNDWNLGAKDLQNDFQDILEEVNDTIVRISLVEAEESCVYVKEVEFGSDGKSQFGGIRSLLETKSFWSSLLKNTTQEAKKMFLLEVEKIWMIHWKMLRKLKIIVLMWEKLS